METSGKIVFQQKRDFTELSNVVFSFIREEFKPLFKRVLLIFTPALLIIGILNGNYLWDFANETNEEIFEILKLLRNAIISFFCFLLFVAVVYTYVEDYINDRTDGPGYVKRTLEVYWKFITQTLMAGIFLAVFSLMYYHIFAAHRWDVPFIAAIVSIVGNLVYFFTLAPISLMYIIRTIEKKPAFECIAKSYTIIHGNWLQTFGAMVLMALIQGIFTFILYLPTEYVEELAFFLGIDIYSNGLDLLIVTQIIFACSLFFSAFLLIYLASRYFDLMERYESKELMEMVDELEAGGDTGSDNEAGTNDALQ